jgi:hypothetical protein
MRTPAEALEPLTWSEGPSAEFALTDLSFPVDYEVGELLGKTPQRHWSVLAWLGRSASYAQPFYGDFIGTVSFELAECEGFGDYCRKTSGVDIVIDDQLESVSLNGLHQACPVEGCGVGQECFVFTEGSSQCELSCGAGEPCPDGFHCGEGDDRLCEEDA